MAKPARKLWYVVRTNVQAEEKALMNIRKSGYDAYLPRMRKDIVHHRTKAIITREFVLFNRYLFVEQPAVGADWYTLRKCEGVECVLGINGTPIPVPSNAVERFREAETDMQFDDTRAAKIHRGEIEKTHEREVRKRFPKNRHIDVLAGPFGGFAGQVVGVTSRLTIKAMLNIFGGLVPVEFDAADIRPEERAA